jgi:hypothetical protein
MKVYDPIKVFERDGLKAIIQGEFKDLHSGTRVLVQIDGRLYEAVAETRGTGGITVVGFK